MPSLCSRLWSVHTSLLLTLIATTAWSTPPHLAPPPLKLFESSGSFVPLGQMEDPELVRELSGEEEVGLGGWTGAESDRVWKEVGGLIRRPHSSSLPLASVFTAISICKILDVLIAARA